jgi:hypothetical protein
VEVEDMVLTRAGRRSKVAGALLAAVGAGAGMLVTPAHAAGPRVAPLSVSLKWAQLFGANTEIDLSSPNLATLDGGGPSIVVGSRVSGCVYALHLANGSTTPGWPQCPGTAVDSTPAVLAAEGGLDDVVVTTGDVAGMNPPAANAGNGFIVEYGPSGTTLWDRTLPDLEGAFGSHPAIAASPAVGDTGTGQTRIVVGGVSLSLYSLDPTGGAAVGGWPQKTADTTFATAAIANVDGTQQIVAASDSTAGPGALNNWNGGSTRLMGAPGTTAWTDASNEVVDSSPAVGNLDGSGPIVVYGHGRHWGGSDADGLTAVNAATGASLWERHLGGYTRGSPALADLLGNGQLDVVEPTWTALGQTTGGVVDAFTPGGSTLWGPVTLPEPPGESGNPNTITGGVATADFGEGYQDVVVAAGLGFDVLDGRTGAVVSSQGLGLNDVLGQNFAGDGNPANLNMQNTPLVTPDPSGVGDDIAVAGTYGGVNGDNTQGFVAVYHVTGGPNSVGSGAWPQFHHDAQLTGSAIAPAPPPGTCMPDVPPCSTEGYWEVATDGGIFAYGNAPFFGSMGGRPLARPVVGIAATADRRGYWEVASDGGVFAFGDAQFHGSMGAAHLNQPVVSIAPTPDGGGYWEVASDGGVFAFGDAQFHGSMGGTRLARPVVGIAPTADGGGYWEVASDGGVFAFGDAQFHGSTGAMRLNQPVVGITPTPDGGGYWMVASDGGVFAFGDAQFHGSMGGARLNRPVVGISATRTGNGYWMIASDGGVFSFGDSFFRGSAGNLVLNAPVTGVAANS